MTSRLIRILNRWREQHAELRDAYRDAEQARDTGRMASLARQMNEVAEAIRRLTRPKLPGKMPIADGLFAVPNVEADDYPYQEVPKCLRRWTPKAKTA